MRARFPSTFCGLLQATLIWIACCIAMPCWASDKLDKVTLQLKWTHAFQFAGYYAAKEKGYYKEAGLDVDIVPAHPETHPVLNVLNGQAEYGIGNSSLLLARQVGQPVVVLAVIFQHSPMVILARYDSATQSVHDLIGKRIMLEPQSDELEAYLRREGVRLEQLQRIPHSYSPQDLMDGKVDAISAFVTNEAYYLDKVHFRYQVYTPRSAGIDFYGDNLFTTEAELRQHPQRVKAFREASLRGWQYAVNHADEIARLIHDQYDASRSLESLQYEARKTIPLLMPDLVEIGYMSTGRWRHIADTYAELGLLPTNFPIDDMIYDPNPQTDLTWAYVVAGLGLVVSGIAFYIHHINRRLTKALANSRHAAEALRDSEERHRMLADHASDVIWTLDTEGNFTYISPSIQKLSGFLPEEMMQLSPIETAAPESAAIIQKEIDKLLDAIRNHQPVEEFRGEIEQTRKGGGAVWTEVRTTPMHNAAGQIIGILGVTRDVSERRQVEDRMRHMAQHDPLTGLPNRALFSDRLNRALATAKREQRKLAVMFLDLNKFKPVNDTYGHAVGDQLLVQAAERIQHTLRESDTVARIGGDEFVVLLPVVDGPDIARHVAGKIHRTLVTPFVVGELTLQVSCSIGIALFPDHGLEEIELAKQADIAMYRAKQGPQPHIDVAAPTAAQANLG